MNIWGTHNPVTLHGRRTTTDIEMSRRREIEGQQTMLLSRLRIMPRLALLGNAPTSEFGREHRYTVSMQDASKYANLRLLWLA